MYGVTITELIEKLGLRNMTMELDTDAIVLVHPDVNRPALQLTGFLIILTRTACRLSDMWSRPISIN